MTSIFSNENSWLLNEGRQRPMEGRLRNLIKFSVATIAASLLVGCGEEDFTGSYRHVMAGQSLVLDIRGSKAKVFAEIDGRVFARSDLNVSVKGEKLFLDSEDGADRVVMKRNVDERSLDCLNCKVMSFVQDEVLWKFDPKGPYDLDQLLRDQARKDEEDAANQARKAKEEAANRAIREKEEAARLSTYSGALDRVVNECVQKGLSRRLCECIPRRLKTNGVSDTDFIKLTNPKFRPANQAERALQSAYSQRLNKSLSQCMAPGS